LFSRFVLEYAIRKKAQENHVGLKLNGTHELLLCADDVHLLRANINNIKRNVEVFLFVHPEELCSQIFSV
jgi:hypothetical protein